MKKYIFLVDVDNCKFLIVNNNSRWELPTLTKISDANKIEERFYKEYKIPIEKIKVVIDKKDFVLVKCFAKNKRFDKSKVDYGVINDISKKISNEFQVKLLLDISLKISLEMINDSFWLGVILTTEDNLQDKLMQALITDFLLFFSSSFCEEILKYKFGDIKDPNYVSNKKIKELRKTYFKKCPLYSSSDIKNIVKLMGMNFENYTFDTVLFFVNGELIDINSRTWNNRNKENFELYNGIVLSPRRWIKNFLPQLNDEFEEIRKPYVDEFINRFNKNKITPRTYSTFKMFNKNTLSEDEKIYILQRIGLLKTTMFISDNFGSGNYFYINEKEDIKIDFDRFLLKVKATLIEILWHDNSKNNIPFLNQILKTYPKQIPDKFFLINRKCRDNIHYGFYNELSSDEIKLLKDFQDIYLKYVISEFEKELNINFNISHKILLFLARIQYMISNH